MSKNKVISLIKSLIPLYIYLGITFIISFGYIIIKSIFFAILNYSENIDKLKNDSYIIPSIISSVICIVVFTFMYKKGVKNGKYSTQNKKIPFKKYLLIVFLAFPLCISVNYIISFTNIAQYDKAFQEVQNQIYSPPLYLQILSTGIIAPICEELMFRNLIQRNISKFFSYRITIIISALVFAIAHGNITQGIYAFIIGVVFGILFEKYRSVYVVIVLHMTLNIVSVLWTYLESNTIWFNNKYNAIVLFIATFIASIFTIRKLLKY